MKRILLFVLLLVLGSTSFAEIIELKSFKDLNLSQVDQKTLVVFDIDNTLVRQNSMIGTHQWGDYLAERAVRFGVEEKTAKDSQHKAFADVQPFVNVVPVEIEILEMLEQLSKRGISNFALTARSSVLQSVTLRQLQVLKHNFSKSFPMIKNTELLKNYLKDGVIFSGSTPKGELLKLIIENSEQKFTRIIFVDDKAYNLDSVEKSFAQSSIELKSYRYGAADIFIKNFEAVIADTIYGVLKVNGILISDDEARAFIGRVKASGQY